MTRHPQRPVGLPMDLYASYEIDDVKFHDKNAKWYKATEVDSLLDKIKQTLEWHEKREAAIGGTTEEDKPVPSVDDQSLSIPTPLADAVDKINDEINSESSNNAESFGNTDDYNYDPWRQSDYQEAKKAVGLTGVLSPTDIDLETTGSHENDETAKNDERHTTQPVQDDQVSSSTYDDSSIDDGYASEPMANDTPVMDGEAAATPSGEASTLKPVVPELSPVNAPKAAVNPFLRR